jgi:hypothetical protein
MVICDTDKDKLQKIGRFIIPDQWLHIRVFSLPFVFYFYSWSVTTYSCVQPPFCFLFLFLISDYTFVCLASLLFFIFIPDQWLHIRVFSLPFVFYFYSWSVTTHFVFPTYTNPHKLRSKPRQHFLIDKSDHRSFWCYETLFVNLLVKYKSVINILLVIIF